MWYKLALHYLLDLQKLIKQDCGYRDEYTPDELEAIIAAPDEHLSEAKKKLLNLISSFDKETRQVYYAFYYQGQIDGILGLFRFKNQIDERNDKMH